MTTFKGELPCLNEVKIAKNYLSADELKILNNLVSGYFDFAEIQALRHKPMYMDDYVRQLDNILLANITSKIIYPHLLHLALNSLKIRGNLFEIGDTYSRTKGDTNGSWPTVKHLREAAKFF